MTQVEACQATWVTVCRLADLLPERGVAALVDGRQVALVRLVDDTLHAVDQLDPFSGAYVMSRGIVGTATVDGEVVPTLASPMHKQVFDLRSGRCLSDAALNLGTWSVRQENGQVQVLARTPP